MIRQFANRGKSGLGHVKFLQFTKDDDMFILIATSIFAVLMTILMFIIRIKTAKKPVTAQKIVLPPLMMSTGALMYIFPPFRLSLEQIAEAVCVGILFSLFLIKSSKLEIRDNEIFLKKSNIFFYVFGALIIVRMTAKFAFSRTLDPGELGGMFWLLAFSMILPWRLMLYRKFRRLRLELQKTSEFLNS